MKHTEVPHVDTRRADQFRGELLARARAWIPGWSLEESPGDFGAALLDVAARFSAQVAERLDRSGEKLSLGLLDWLAIRGKAAKPARMPVVLKLADTARDPVPAARPVRLQADVNGASVVFETETDVTLVPGTLAQLVGVDAPADAWYLPPPGISSLDPLEPQPNLWSLKNFAAAGATKLQLDPTIGLDAGTYVEMGGLQYRVVSAEGDLVTLEPGLINAAGLPAGTPVTRVVKFDPFGGSAHNWQEHALYLGDKEVLNIEALATIEVVGAAVLRDATWEFFGKAPGDADADWRAMKLLDPAPPGSVLLEKPAGAIEPTNIGDGEPNRFIRARLVKVEGSAPLLDVEEIKLVINRGYDGHACPDNASPPDPGAQADGFANTTPLAFTSVFYPLGREPKQFDTFYLGCADAFSKKSAKVAICFELADASTNAYATIGEGTYANVLIASIGQDSALHLNYLYALSGTVTKFRNREPLQPPKPGANGITPDGSPIALVQKPIWRPPMWSVMGSGYEFVYVAVSAGATVWVWQEDLWHPDRSGWISFGPIVNTPGPNSQVTGLVCVTDGTPTLYAAFEGKLHSHSANVANATDRWKEVELKKPSNAALPGTVQTIGPIKLPVGIGRWRVKGIIGVIRNGGQDFAYAIDAAGKGAEIDNAVEVRDATIPVGIDIGGTNYYFWEQKGSKNVIRAVETDAATGTKASQPGSDPPDDIAGGSLDVSVVAGNAAVVAVGTKGSRSWLIRWTPFVAPEIYSENEVPNDSGPLGGAPTVLTNYVLAPGARGEAWTARWRPEQHFTQSVTLAIGLVVDNISLLSSNDLVIIDDGVTIPPDETATVTAYAGGSGGKSLFALAPASSKPDFGKNVQNPMLVVFRVSASQRTGNRQSNKKLKLDGLDTLTDQNDWLAVFDSGSIDYYKVTNRTGGIVTLDGSANLTDPNPTYVRGVALTARIAPFFDLSTAHSTLLTVDDLKGNPFVFKNPFDPLQQLGEAFIVDAGIHPRRIVLQQNWRALPNTIGTPQVAFDAATSNWVRQLGDAPTNPELVWEYWNGTSWAQLQIDVDETQDFTASGRVEFKVPRLLAPSDVNGKTNYWVRARLISGDYGREKVTVVTVTNGNTSTQEVNRDTSNFHPPLVVAMRIRYALDTSVYPQALLTRDSGSWRDQSDANRAPGARVEGFVPLALLMRRLSGSDAAADVGADADCGCADCASTDHPASGATTGTAGAGPTAVKSAATDDRSVLLGFDAGPQGEPVNVLLLVEERPHDGFAPLIVEALIKDRFERLTARDDTRALGESGIVSTVIPVKPSPRDLFGRSLSWLRLRPSRIDANGKWRPIIRGAYLNATWASATETLTREPLGSSDGRPNLRVRVARPPLLQDSLELRVREPLDEEERQGMLDADETVNPDRRSVKYDIPDTPGNWVLWRQVADPADYGPHERVYALDESLGEIQFGDGVHGMIPPIGRDAVVAFAYQRTEPPADGSDSVPANAVTARTKLNLVTPVESVEAAFAADHAAGGAPPESAERVQRCGNARLRHRGRALVLSDYEDLALASSPDIAQARAFKRAGAVRLVVVMRGAKPLPDPAQRRTLLRELQAAASPLTGEHGALTIQGARLRRLRLWLTLRVATLDDTGAVANAVTRAVTKFFASGEGGVDGKGWPLGVAPGDDDIAFALGDLPLLEGIADIGRQEIGPDGTAGTWNSVVRPDELVLLDDDPLRFEFATLEVEA